jgi:hypothetical protein
MNSALHFLHIYHLDFHLKKNILPSNFEKILWSNKFLKVPPWRNYFLWKSRWHLLLMRPWPLNLDYTAFPFLHFGKLYAYPPNFYWISKHWKQPLLPTNFFFPSPSIVIILQSMWSLWLRFFLQTISIIRYKILWLEVEKHHFILIIGPHVNKYIFQAQYSPKRPWNFRG